jgi:hypothetical protein
MGISLLQNMSRRRYWEQDEEDEGEEMVDTQQDMFDYSQEQYGEDQYYKEYTGQEYEEEDDYRSGALYGPVDHRWGSASRHPSGYAW